MTASPERTRADRLASALGAKAEGLAWLEQTFPGAVPRFVAVPFAHVLVDGERWLEGAQQAMDRALEAGSDTVGARALADAAAAVRVDRGALAAALTGLEGAVAVRTSAASEDGRDSSFAGQYVTVLDVMVPHTPSVDGPSPADGEGSAGAGAGGDMSGGDAPGGVAHGGIAPGGTAPGGIEQGGVAPADAVADAVERCARSLVSERVAAYSRAAGVSVTVGGSVVIQRMAPRGRAGVMFTQTSRGETEVLWSSAGAGAVVDGGDAERFAWPVAEPLPGRAPVPLGLLRAARDIQAARGPSDVEFALGGGVHLLQVRPVTADRDPKSLTWDSSNIGENYPGVTLPLTYSFIRDVYADVYQEFFRLLGRSERELRERRAVFRNTLGYVRGRVHYNIDNWFEMAAMLPGGRANQEFFSAMLQPVKDGEARERPRPGVRGMLALAGGAARFAWALADAERRSRRFRRLFSERYARYRAVDFDALTTDAALATLSRIRGDLLALWAVPILNDVRLMVAHGLLVRRFGEDRDAYLAYLTGLTDRASIAPLAALSRLGRDLRAMGVSAPAEACSADAVAAIDRYLADFGGRAPDELQLENPRLTEDRDTLVALALGAADAPVSEAAVRGPAPARSRGLVTRVLGHHVRRAIDHRERFRLNRAQVFGIARDAYLAVGRRLAGEGALRVAEDILWLTVDEVDGAVYGHAWDGDLAATVERRRARWQEYAQAPLTKRVTSDSELAGARLDQEEAAPPGALAGAGVSAGSIEAEAVVLTEFDPTVDVRGKVLVAPHADPGWTLLIVAAAAVVTERGNALSHVAIVGRELGIPVVVGALDATGRVATGDRVAVDGRTGQIHVRTA